MKVKVPLSLLCSATLEPLDVNAEEQSSRVNVRGVANTGGMMLDNGIPVVLDLSGMHLPPEGQPIKILFEHTTVLGQVDAWKLTERGVEFSGWIHRRGEHNERIIEMAREGYVWEQSIRAEPLTADDLEFVPQGKAVQANGKTLQGPLVVYRKWRWREVSFVAVGLDAGTSSSVAASASPPGSVTIEMADEPTTTAAMTVEQLRAEYPDLIAEIEQAAYDRGVEEERARATEVAASLTETLAGDDPQKPTPALQAAQVAASAIKDGTDPRKTLQAFLKAGRAIAASASAPSGDPTAARRRLTASATTPDDDEEDDTPMEASPVVARRVMASLGALGKKEGVKELVDEFLALPEEQRTKFSSARAYIGRQLRTLRTQEV